MGVEGVTEPDDRGAGVPLIEASGISKMFPGVKALDDFSLVLRAGEVCALTGENGSGKSTFAKVLNGSLQPDSGFMKLDGQRITFPNPAAALRLGIVSISQELTLATSLTVAENVFMGRMPRKRGGAIDWETCRSEARKVLDDLGVHVSERTLVRDLSVELQQEVEIARAVSSRARLLILDEATSSLSEAATVRLLEIVEEQRRRGVAVLMISHKMPELYQAASVATVLRDGRLVRSVPLPETPESDLVRLMVGRDLNKYYGARDVVPGEVVLRVQDLASADGILHPTSLEVRRGEILGVAGLVGSGKAELGLALGGAIASSGTVQVCGKPVSVQTPRTALAGGIGFVPDDRKRHAILPQRSVAENFALQWLKSTAKFGVLRLRHERNRVMEAMSRYGVVAANPQVAIATLSGGNQQKVVLGRMFDKGCQVLVLSEPTRGIDVGSKSAVYQMLQEQAAAGVCVVLISSELPELLGMSDRVAVFHRGEIHAEFDAVGLDEETVAAVAVSGRDRAPAP